MNKDSVRNRFLDRLRENQALLSKSLQPGFRFKQVTMSGEVDATEDYQERLRRAIADYQQAVDMLGPTA